MDNSSQMDISPLKSTTDLNNRTKVCNVCNKPQNEKGRKIKVLSCKHSFCKGCVKKQLHEGGYMVCPLCKGWVQSPLKIGPGCDMSDSIRRGGFCSDGEKRTCDKESEGKVAVEGINENLIRNGCLGEGGVAVFTRNVFGRSVSPLRSLKVESSRLAYKAETMQKLCGKHAGQQVCFVCLTCAATFCALCKEEHVNAERNDHDIQDLQTAYENIPLKISCLSEQYSDTCDKVQELMEGNRKSLAVWYKSIKFQVNERVKDVINNALRWKRSVEKELDDTAMRADKDMAGMEQNLEERHDDFTTYVSLVNEALKSMDVIAFEYLASVQGLCKQLTQEWLDKEESTGKFADVILEVDDSAVQLGRLVSKTNDRQMKQTLRTCSSSDSSSCSSDGRDRSGDMSYQARKDQEFSLSTMSEMSASLSTHRPAKQVSCLDLGQKDEVIKISVSFNNDVLLWRKTSDTLANLKHNVKQYQEKWVKPCQGIKISDCHVSPTQDIVIRDSSRTYTFTSEFEQKDVFRGPYGDLLAVHEYGYVYGHAALRTGKYVVKQHSADHQRFQELCLLAEEDAAPAPHVALHSPHLVLLHTSSECVQVFNVQSGSLVTCSIITPLPASVKCIAFSGWRLFILDHLSYIHVYCITSSRLLTMLSPADLGLDSGCEVASIWCSCVCLLHVRCTDGERQRLLCFDLLQNKLIWKV